MGAMAALEEAVPAEEPKEAAEAEGGGSGEAETEAGDSAVQKRKKEVSLR